MPFLSTAPVLPSSTNDQAPSNHEAVLLDRDTMGHWSRKKIDKNELLSWQAHYNSSSLDGLPGLRAAMWNHRERVWWSLVRAWVRKVLLGQREGIAIGVLLGVGFVVLGQMLLDRVSESTFSKG